MTLDTIIGHLKAGAEIRAICDDATGESQYALVRVLGGVPPIVVLDLRTRGVLEPDEDGRYAYSMKVAA